MNRKIVLGFLICLLMALPLVSMAADEKLVIIDGVSYLVSSNPVWDIRGELMRIGLVASGGGDLIIRDDLTVDDDCTITGDLIVTGTQTYTGGADFSGDLTLENDLIISNGTAVISFTFNDDAVEVGDVQFITSNTSGEDNNYFRMSWWFEDDGSVSTEAAYVDFSMDDETSNTFDSTIEFAVVTNDTLAAELNLNGTDLYPETDDGLNLGKVGNEFGALFLDGIATVDGLRVDDAITDIGGGSYTLANGDNDLGIAGDLEVDTDALFQGETTFLGVIFTKSSVSLTSPSVTIDLAGKTWIELNTDGNQTGATLTNGVVGHLYMFTMGAGSNTMQFDDDGVNMALGGNIVLTEGDGDSLTLLCVATDDYTRVFSADN